MTEYKSNRRLPICRERLGYGRQSNGTIAECYAVQLRTKLFPAVEIAIYSYCYGSENMYNVLARSVYHLVKLRLRDFLPYPSLKFWPT